MSWYAQSFNGNSRRIFIRPLTGVLLVSCLVQSCVTIFAAEPCRIEVVEKGSGWPVPLVELRTTHHVRFVTDNAGVIALDSPELMGREIWFDVIGNGYEVPKDGWGQRGVRLKPESGKTLKVEVNRTIIARRLGRITGGGLFAESQKLGLERDWRESGVFGCDTVQNAVHRGRMFWLWGDTTIPNYPMGIFSSSAAMTAIQPLTKFEPPVRLKFDYFSDTKGAPRGVANMPGDGPTWVTGCISLPDKTGTPRLVGSYTKVKPPMEIYERGLCVWNDATENFEPLRVVWAKASQTNAPTTPDWHPVRWKDATGKEWLLFGNPLPTLRCLPTFEAWKDASTWEVLKPQPTLVSAADGKPVKPHSGAIAWNAFRRRWVTVFMETFGKPSAFGEMWYAEADSPTGPWGKAVKILTHANYTFYNPVLHPEFTPTNSPILLFEGTYTMQFADKPHPTPRYDYNQILYRLDLDDPALGPASEKPAHNYIMASLAPLITTPSHWLLGPAYYAQRQPLRFFPKWIEEHGDIFRIKSPFGEATVVAAPELARQVLVDRATRYQQKSRSYAVLRILMGNGLVTSEGEFWRGQRKLVQPAFHRRKLDALFTTMVDRVNQCIERLAPAAESGEPVDLGPVLSQLTLDIISRAMFSSDVQGAAVDVSRHIAVLNEYALHMLRNPWLFLVPRRFPTPFTYGPVRSLKSLNDIVRGIIQARRKQAGAHDDLLSMLLSACEEGTGRGMTDEQLRDEVMTIFVAGHETTANAVAWLLYLVSQHQEVEERVLAEIDAHWPDGGLTMENIGAFNYMRQVIEESLRVYPTIWSIGRRCTEADELGGYQIPVGMNVVVPIFHFHWNERFWPEPQKFDPSRFTSERRPSADAMTYFPFGAGPRSCIGNHFAMQELMIMTILFYRRFQFRVQPGFVVEPDPLITLRPKHGMKMTLRARTALSHLNSPINSVSTT